MVIFFFLQRLEQSCLKQSWENHQQLKTLRNIIWIFFTLIMQIYIFSSIHTIFLNHWSLFGRTLGIDDIYDVLDKSLISIEWIWKLCKLFFLLFFGFDDVMNTLYGTFLAHFSAVGTDQYYTELWSVLKDKYWRLNNYYLLTFDLLPSSLICPHWLSCWTCLSVFWQKRHILCTAF